MSRVALEIAFEVKNGGCKFDKKNCFREVPYAIKLFFSGVGGGVNPPNATNMIQANVYPSTATSH